jgi:ABC-type phosphate transport system permease subunit
MRLPGRASLIIDRRTDVANVGWQRSSRETLEPGATEAALFGTEVSSPLYLSALIEAGFVLFILTSAMNVLAHWLEPGKQQRRALCTQARSGR